MHRYRALGVRGLLLPLGLGPPGGETGPPGTGAGPPGVRIGPVRVGPAGADPPGISLRGTENYGWDMFAD